MTRRRTQAIGGLREIADRYDGFILDLWGTLHDGATPYPGVLECLAELRRRGKHCVLLSNAPRRAAPVGERVSEIGIAPALYDAIVTSGEAGWHALLQRGRPDAAEAVLRDLGPHCLHLGPERDRGMMDGLPVESATQVEACDFILCTGLDRGDEAPGDYDHVLRPAAQLGRPMICINPDLIIHRVGKLEHCAGALAARYEELGGPVTYYGKPFPAVYARTEAALGGIAHERILAVGDSLRTDIAGANRVGIASLLLTGGIHVEELLAADGALATDKLAAASEEHDAWPDWVGFRLVW
jgi:HAD superfamily hydrolase (TIGR01459 family)